MTGYTLTLLENDPRLIRGRAAFAADFVGFNGHFPESAGGPVLPGFWHVQVSLDLLGMTRGISATLRTVEIAKFLRAIRPGEAVEVTLQPLDGGFAVALGASDDVRSSFWMTVS